MPDNKLNVVDVRAIASEIECELAFTVPMAPGKKPTRLRIRYCICHRQVIAWIDAHGDGNWRRINPERPLINDEPNWQDERAKLSAINITALFERLPPDPRAEEELLHHLFGPENAEPTLTLPPGWLSGWQGGLLLTSPEAALFIRPIGGWWRYAGHCPGWFPTVHGDKIYCWQRNKILSRPMDTPQAAWEPVCDLPTFGKGATLHSMRIIGGQLVLIVEPGALYIRPLNTPDATWTQQIIPRQCQIGVVASARLMFTSDMSRLLARPLAASAGYWKDIGSWPQGCYRLVIVGDRLLALSGAGPIYARPATDEPNLEWRLVGRVRDPYARDGPP